MLVLNIVGLYSGFEWLALGRILGVGARFGTYEILTAFYKGTTSVFFMYLMNITLSYMWKLVGVIICMWHVYLHIIYCKKAWKPYILHYSISGSCYPFVPFVVPLFHFEMSQNMVLFEKSMDTIISHLILHLSEKE